ncbi:MAG: RIP metalloprotease RseP [Telluria sp.]
MMSELPFYIFAFLLSIGPLIIFHELGHYLLARLCGVKVLRFSVGMGKIVWSRRFGPDQTEWAVSMLPIGGYVKMLDNRDPETAVKTPEDAGREFTGKSVWRRIAIVAAGPVFNFILAIAIFCGLFMYGMPDTSTRLRVMPESAAVYQAGVRGGDQVVAVNGKPVAGWTDLRWEVMQVVMDKTALQLDLVQPNGARYSATVPGATLAALNVESDFLRALGLGFRLSPAVLGPLPQGPASSAGLKEGDVVVNIGGKPALDSPALIELVRASKGEPLVFDVLRSGRPLSATVTPVLDAATKQYQIKANLALPQVDTVTVSVGPVTALAKAARKTWDTSSMTLKMLGRIITGEASLKNITGPVTIAEYAGKTLSLGPIEFIAFIAFVSISLGVMNLLPIPVLDGGHLLYYSLEVLTGRPMPERFIDFAQRAGVVMLVMLMSLALFNDAMRHL